MDKKSPKQSIWIVSGFSAHERSNLLALEGHTVGTFGHGGVSLVGANLNLAKSTVVNLLSVMLTLLYGAFNILVFHDETSFPYGI